MNSEGTADNTLIKVISTILIIPLTFLAVFTSSWVGLILFILFLYLDTFIHELGHILIGKLVKFGRFTVFLGNSKVIFRKQISDVLLILCSGSGGLTSAAKFAKKHIQLRLFIFTMGGIIFNSLIVLLIILFYGIEIEPDKFNIPLLFAASNLYCVITNLIPFNYYKNDVQIPNDGLRLLKILFRKEQMISDLFFAEDVYNANELLVKKKFDLALVKYEELVKRSPKSIILSMNYSICLMKCLQFDAARKVLFEIVNQNKDKNLDSLIKNNIAWLYLLEFKADLLNSADRYSEEALLSDPSSLNIQNTRGSILIQMGRVDEGISILTRLINLEKPIDKIRNNPMNFIFLAYGYLLKGEFEETGRFLKPLGNYEDKLDPDELFLLNTLREKTNNFKCL